MYGLHLHRKTLMMRLLWVMMGMYVPFVAPSLTLRRCSCVTSGNCNISLQCCTDCIDTHTYDQGGPLVPRFFFCWTAPRDHQPPTADCHQPPTSNCCQPLAATNRQPPMTANRHQPPIPNHQLPPTTINRHQPPSTASRQPPTANRQHMVCPCIFLGNLGTGTLLFFSSLRTALRMTV